MKNLRHLTLFCILLLCQYCCRVIADDRCQQVQNYRGQIVDTEGCGVDNVDIYLIDPKRAGQSATLLATTDSQGYFLVQSIAAEPKILELRDRKNGAFTKDLPQDDTRQRGGRIVWLPPADQSVTRIEYPILETIVLLHDNDLHFDFNFVEQFSARVEAYRSKFDDVFLLNAGDVFVRRPERWEKDGQIFHGDVLWYRDQAIHIIDTMNRIGYDVMTLGNHELAAVGVHTREALEKAQFPLLASNVEFNTDLLPPVEKEVILRTSTGRKIGVFGLTLGATDGVKILDRNKTAAAYSTLKDKADIVLALNHIGYAADIQIAEKFGFIDVIIGGHSHTLLSEAEMINQVLVAQAGGCPHQASSDHPKYLGVIKITLENGQLSQKSGQVINLSITEPALSE